MDETLPKIIVVIALILTITIASAIGIQLTSTINTATKGTFTLATQTAWVSITGSTKDGYIEATDATYLTANGASSGTADNSATTLIVSQAKPSDYTIDRGFLYFDSSAVKTTLAALTSGASSSDITLVSVAAGTLQLNPTAVSLETNFTLTLVADSNDVYPSTTLTGGDYLKTHYVTGTSLGTYTTVSIVAINTQFNITLTSDGRTFAYNQANAGNYTKLALLNNNDIAASAPTNNQNVTLSSADSATAAYKPKLFLQFTYTIAGVYTNTQGSTAIDNASNAVYSAFSLSAVVPIILMAGIIIAVVAGAYFYKKKQ